MSDYLIFIQNFISSKMIKVIIYVNNFWYLSLLSQKLTILSNNLILITK